MSLMIATAIGYVMICMFKEKVRWHEPKQVKHYGDDDMANAYRQAFEQSDADIQVRF